MQNGHPNVRGYMAWDMYNDFNAQHYNCEQYGASYNKDQTLSWNSYDWINTLKTIFLNP